MTTTNIAEEVVDEERRRKFVEVARDFARREIAPHAAEWDREKKYPADVVRQLGELGFFGLLVSEEFDGLGLDAVTYLMILEEIAAADASVSITLAVHNSLPSYILESFGTPEQHEQWLRPMARGELLAAFCVSEADSGSDVAGLRTRAVWSGSSWVLNGTKAWVTNGDVADILLVMVRTSDDPTSRARGLSFFMVPADTPGLELGKAEDKMGLRASRTTQVALTNVELGLQHLIGEEGKGFHYAMEGLDHGRMGVAAQAIGIGRQALEHSVKYAGERKQFEKPIKDFQGISFMLADMETQVSAARALLHEAARAKQRGQNITMWASMAKLFASEMAVFVTQRAVQVFGGYGYMRDYPVERLLRDAKVTEIYEGTSEVQRIVIARELYSHHN
jgi:alkylation response protein AidB-like acyl-CoA dehydrogenase